MQCYKCNSTDNLSIRYTTRTGTKTMICRDCRRNTTSERDKHIRLPKVNKEWEARAKESMDRINRKYAKVA